VISGHRLLDDGGGTDRRELGAQSDLGWLSVRAEPMSVAPGK
jgi:hypothetical protein